jgi:hypothetical protein
MPSQTPPRASQVFGFLTDRTKARLQDRPLPSLPHPISSRFLQDSSCEDDSETLDIHDTPLHNDTNRLSRSHSARPILHHSSSESRREDLFAGLPSVNRAKSQGAFSRDMVRDCSPAYSPPVTGLSILRGPRPLPVPQYPTKPVKDAGNNPLYLDPEHISRATLGERLNCSSSGSIPSDTLPYDGFTRIPSRQEHHRKASNTISLGDTLVKDEGGRKREKENNVVDSRTFSAYVHALF